MRVFPFLLITIALIACKPRSSELIAVKSDSLQFEIVGFKIDETREDRSYGGGVWITYRGNGTIISRSENPETNNGLLGLHIYEIDGSGQPNDFEEEIQIIKGVGKISTHDFISLDKGETSSFPVYKFQMT